MIKMEGVRGGGGAGRGGGMNWENTSGFQFIVFDCLTKRPAKGIQFVQQFNSHQS